MLQILLIQIAYHCQILTVLVDCTVQIADARPIVFSEVVVLISITSGHFKMPIHEDQEHSSSEQPSKVHVNSLPGARRPKPGMKWCNSRLAFDCLTTDTGLGYFFQQFVDVWPPHVAPGDGFHPNNTRVFPVQLFHYLVM